MTPKPTATRPLTLPLTLAFGAALVASCMRRDAAPPPPHPPAAATSARVMARSQAAPPNADPKNPTRGTLADRLTAEVATRPPTGLRVEDVTAAFRSAGVPVGPLTQVLGRTIGARYCASTATPAGVAMAICEFADEAEAARGLDYSRRQFDRLVPGRTLLRNRGTVLTLTPGDPSSVPATDAGRAAAVFASL